MRWSVAAVSLMWVGLVAAAPTGRFTDLGVQINSSTCIGTTFANSARDGHDKQGRDAVYTVMRGHPAKLHAFDANTGELIQTLPLPGADGAWNACTASDGSVYVGSDSNGHLYRYIPGEKEAQDLGNPLPGQTWVWDVTAGKDGEVFGGTYPGARVFRYHPKDGFSDVGKGAVAAGESYVRCVAADAEHGMVYAGVGSHAHLIAINLKTGEKADILPQEYRDQEFVYGLDRFGKYLIACLTRANKSVVIETGSNRVVGIIPAMAGQQIITQAPDGSGDLYYTINGELMRANIQNPAEPQKMVACPDALGLSWSDGKLIGFTRYGVIWRFDPVTKKLSKITCQLPAEPTDIQSIELGPDGRIWTGGYLSGGNAAFDPATNKSEQYRGLSQAEDMTVVGKTIYFGLYPGAKLSCYDTTKLWDQKSGNPRQFGNLGSENQSRPMAMCGVESLNKVFIGTIPEYGQLGGVLATYDIATGKLDVHHDVVTKQSICSLVFDKGLIIGGTTISGGLGQKPEAKEAKLFVWDPASNNEVFETTAVPGAAAITGLFVGPDGNVWGMAEGTLFIFDPATRQIVESKEILPIHYSAGNHVWRDASFALSRTSEIFGTMGDRFFQLDPHTKTVTILREKGAGLLTMDRAGRLYFRDGTHLWRYDPDATDQQR